MMMMNKNKKKMMMMMMRSKRELRAIYKGLNNFDVTFAGASSSWKPSGDADKSNSYPFFLYIPIQFSLHISL